ncbi:glycosyltransferase [Brucella intermedia]|uniref:glycosyltransferase n=1 Tax=Brucella intermedia TaxID=94625 RepID=UPI00124F5D6A|nr:glycosyltransferase [Brucella intermedia]KAB2707600.1 glycosyltransferase [Brucella intermedia]MBM7329501.1 glycosyltransferase [Agrobacterium sp. S2]
MRILFVSPETHFNGGGGIATYSKFSEQALSSSGHEVFSFSWSFDEGGPTRLASDAQFFELKINGNEIWKMFPQGPFNQALSYYLLPYILEVIDTINPDIIESTDYLGPLFAYQNCRRNGALKPTQVKPVVVYNHGFQREIYRANASIPTAWERVDTSIERTTLRWADMVFAPSNHAKSTVVRQCGNLPNIVVVPEPYYWGSPNRKVTKPDDRLAFLGRLSISKGLDHIVHFLNVLNSFAPVNGITLVGKKDYIPFKINDAEEYVLKKIAPNLRDKIQFTGRLDTEQINSILRDPEEKGYSLNFSPPETFNFAFLEMLDFGWTPFGLAGTAVAEFYPDHLQRYLVPRDFDLCELPYIYKYLSLGNNFWTEVRDHSKKVTDPATFALNYDRAVSHLVKPKQTISATVKQPARAHDVTFLMATFNPNARIHETLESINRQTVEGAKVLICSDGSNDHESLNRLDTIASDQVKVIKSLGNEGLCATRRKLISACDSPLSIFIDDDDIIDSVYLERTLSVYNNNTFSANAVLTWRKNFGTNNHLVINHNIDDYEFFLWNDLRMTSLIETATLKSVNFRPSMRHGEADDWDFWLRFNELGYKAAMLPQALFHYRVTPGSMSWPWSSGQAALTAELLSKRILTASKQNRVPDDLMLEIMTSRETFRMHAEGSGETVAMHSLSQQDQIAILRGKFIRAARERHPITGRIISVMHRATSWLARKSIGGSL